jgi:NAD(P)-dependent dehydrogenase (short-subunit alcohol dehydrogenase family)
MTLMPRSVVLITGASSGFGEACAEHLARLGYSVYGTSRRASFPEGGAERNPRMIPMDVCDDASVRAAVDFVLAEEGRLDVVVNNAGLGMAGAVEDTSVEEAKALFETNFFGMHRVCRAVLPTLLARIRSHGSSSRHQGQHQACKIHRTTDGQLGRRIEKSQRMVRVAKSWSASIGISSPSATCNASALAAFRSSLIPVTDGRSAGTPCPERIIWWRFATPVDPAFANKYNDCEGSVSPKDLVR